MMRHLTARLAALIDPLTAGGRILLLRFADRFGWRAVAIGTLVLLYAAPRYRTWIGPALLVLAGLAWMHAPDKATEPQPEPEGEQPSEAVEEVPADPLPALLWELIGEARGVHLATIVDHLHESGLDPACDRAAVRAALDRRRIPVRGSVREADGRVNQGVHRADLEAWEQAHSPSPSQGGPKRRSYPATTPVTSDVAAPATAVATPATPTD
ncbi:hypothetical protein [Streptomyces sp. NPDC051997]|uniref:hypothetical protein n=1 Tax=Streptomyces sp. NPDC051997 TaxID=3155611 RepID=UPI00343EFB45